MNMFALLAFWSSYLAIAPAQDEYKARIQKIPVFHARAADLVGSFGGSILQDSTTIDMRTFRTQRQYGAEAAGMLPDPAPEAIVALEVDNTILIKGSEESIREMVRLIRLMDFAPRPIEVSARAFLTITDPAGKQYTFELRGEGHSLDNHAMHIKTTTQSAAGPGKPWALLEATSDADVFTQTLGENSVRLEADWYVDILWKRKGAAKSERLHNVFRTNAIARSGEKVRVASANQKVTDATISVLLELTPRRLPELNYVPRPKGTGDNRKF